MNDVFAARLIEAIERIAVAQERIADADERRNELLVADSEERRRAWEASQRADAERWGSLRLAPEATEGQG